MKGNITKLIFGMSERKYSLFRHIVVVLAIAIAVCAVVMLVRGCTGGDSSDGSFRAPLPDMNFSDDDGYTPVGIAKGISIPATTGIVLSSNTLTQDISIGNPCVNNCIFVVYLYLSDGTLLFKSEPLRPSDMLSTIRLNKVLSAGVYKNAVFVYECYTNDSTMTAISRCEFPVEIKVIE